MLHKDTWPNLLPYAQIALCARSNHQGKYLRFHREFSLFGRPVRLELPPIDAILTLAENLGEEIQ